MVLKSVPMRLKERKIQSVEEVDALLREGLVCRLATSYEGEPYVVPLNYVYMDGKLYFHSFLKGKKLRNLRANPLVCFEIDNYSHVIPAAKACDFAVEYSSVIVMGNARQVKEKPLMHRAFAALMDKYAAGMTFEHVTDADLKTVSLWEIEIIEKVGKHPERD